MGILPTSLRHTFTASDLLTHAECEQLFHLNVTMFPLFRTFYEQNRYYSVVKPQEVLQVWNGSDLIASGKFLWRTLALEPIGTVTLFAFGMLIYTAYQRLGIGTVMIQKIIERARTMSGDLLYGSSQVPFGAEKAEQRGFYVPRCPVTYTHGCTGDTVDVAVSGYTPYLYDLRGSGLLAQIDRLPILHLGEGPL